MREDIMEVKKEIKELKEQSFAMELYKNMQNEMQKINKRFFFVLIIVLCMWFATIGYLVYILNDIETVNDTVDIQDVKSIDNSHIKIGDDIWEKSH